MGNPVAGGLCWQNIMDELVISSTIDDIPRVREFIRTRLETLPISPKERSNVSFSVVEAVVNAINHGNASDPGKQVRITLEANGEKVTVTVADSGPGFDPDSVPDPTSPERLENPTGRGIFFMRQMMNSLDFDFSPSGTTVSMVKLFNGKH